MERMLRKLIEFALKTTLQMNMDTKEIFLGGNNLFFIVAHVIMYL